jgi:hypothetical protein
MSGIPVINIAKFHPQAIDTSAQACMGRREVAEPDRRFKPFIYGATQCKNKAVQDSGGLCETCIGHLAEHTATPERKSGWHGRVDQALDLMPATSHIAGGPWYLKRRTSFLSDFQFFPNGRLMTAKQEGRLDEAPVVSERELKRFARGEVPLDIEFLAERRQISTMGLVGILCDLNVDIPYKIRHGSKAVLCAAIRRAMAQPPAPAAQHFNPEEDNYEEEVEVQQMAPAGDSAPTGDEDELNTAFIEEEPEQGGAGGGYQYELEIEGVEWRESAGGAEAAPVRARAKPKRYVPDWDLIPTDTSVRWVIKTPERTLTSCGTYVGEGKIQFGQQIVTGPAAFIKQELTAWKSNGRLPADMKAPSNAWKALEFERHGTWARFDSIRSVA